MRIPLIQSAVFSDVQRASEATQSLEWNDVYSRRISEGELQIILVTEKMVDRAKDILSPFIKNEPKQQGTCGRSCVGCDSAKVIRVGTKFQIPALSYMLGSTLAYYRMGYRCTECSREWS